MQLHELSHTLSICITILTELRTSLHRNFFAQLDSDRPLATRTKVPSVTCHFHPEISPKFGFRRRSPRSLFRRPPSAAAVRLLKLRNGFGGGVRCDPGHPRRPRFLPGVYEGCDAASGCGVTPPRFPYDGYIQWIFRPTCRMVGEFQEIPAAAVHRAKVKGDFAEHVHRRWHNRCCIFF